MKQHTPVVRCRLSAALMIVAGSIVTGCLQQGWESIGGLPVGATAPEITATGWINGDAPTAADIGGKVLVVNAWAYW